MLPAIRLSRLQSHPCIRPPFQRFSCRETASVKVRSKSTKPGKREEEMENNQKPHQDTEDAMSHSFGEGYATRSDEEGFGGVYRGNQAFEKPEGIPESHPAYDKSQGSEVKEKEKSRHQPEKTAMT